jgi:hypothetical protein
LPIFCVHRHALNEAAVRAINFHRFHFEFLWLLVEPFDEKRNGDQVQVRTSEVNIAGASLIHRFMAKRERSLA